MNFAQTLRTTSGRQFKGQVQQVDSMSSSAIFAAYELRANIAAGETILYNKMKYLVARGSVGLMRMIEVTHELAWVRPTFTTDPVSKLKIKGPDEQKGTSLSSVLSAGTISDVFNVSDSKFHLITNSAIQVNDKLGAFTVTFVESRLGLQFAEVK